MTGERPPWQLMVPALAGLTFLLLPLAALVIRMPWNRAAELLTAEEVLTPLRLSLLCATCATALSLLLGIPLAWLLARTRFSGQNLLRALVTLPLVVPPVVGGVALLFAFGRNGVAGQYLAQVGITLPFTTAGVVVAETFVAMPFLVVAVEGGLRAAGLELEEAAATLGARGFTRFRLITWPALVPHLAAGAVLCWARALGEFGATMTFAGNLPGVTQTLPLGVYLSLERDPDAALALSLVMLAVSASILVVLRHRWLPAVMPR